MSNGEISMFKVCKLWVVYPINLIGKILNILETLDIFCQLRFAMTSYKNGKKQDQAKFKTFRFFH